LRNVIGVHHDAKKHRPTRICHIQTCYELKVQSNRLCGQHSKPTTTGSPTLQLPNNQEASLQSSQSEWLNTCYTFLCSYQDKTSHSAPGASQQRHHLYCPHCHVLWLMTSQNQHPLMTSRWKILFPHTSALHTFQEGSYFKKVL